MLIPWTPRYIDFFYPARVRNTTPSTWSEYLLVTSFLWELGESFCLICLAFTVESNPSLLTPSWPCTPRWNLSSCGTWRWEDPVLGFWGKGPGQNHLVSSAKEYESRTKLGNTHQYTTYLVLFYVLPGHLALYTSRLAFCQGCATNPGLVPSAKTGGAVRCAPEWLGTSVCGGETCASALWVFQFPFVSVFFFKRFYPSAVG